MLKKLSGCFPAKVLANEKGFTLIELFICIVMLGIVGMVIFGILAMFVFQPRYNGKAYTEKNGKRYYNLVHLPEKGIIGGVCAGIAYKWEMSPWIPRLGFLFFTCMGGSGAVVYFVIWLCTDSAHAPNDYLERTGG